MFYETFLPNFEMFQPVANKICSKKHIFVPSYVYHLSPIKDKARPIPSTRKETEANAPQSFNNAPQAPDTLQSMHIIHKSQKSHSHICRNE